MARFVVLDVDGVLHPLSEKGLPANAAFEDLSKRADEELEDDGSCVYPAVAGKQRIRNSVSVRRLQSASCIRPKLALTPHPSTTQASSSHAAWLS